ncbi:MAG: transcription-repair coupling factor [Mariprofundaceae bacterium]
MLTEKENRLLESNHDGLAWRLSQLARKPGMHLYICRDLRSYRILSEELSFFLQDHPEMLWRFPAWEVLPYDRVSPHHVIVSSRFSTLARLQREASPQGLMLTSLPAFLQRIAPPEAVAAHVWQLRVGDTLDMTSLKERLVLAGMQSVDRVLGRGEFAARGGTLDLWPAIEDTPIRLDLFGDEIDTIRHFDVESQRSGEHLKAFESVPVREVILDQAACDRFAAAFRARFPQMRKHPMLSAVAAGRVHPGIESLLPLAYEVCHRLIDYLPDATVLHADGDIEDMREHFATHVRSQFEMMRMSKEPTLPPQELFAVETPMHTVPLPFMKVIDAPLSIVRNAAHPLQALLDDLKNYISAGGHILLVGHGPGQQERMCEMLTELDIEIQPCRGLHDMDRSTAISTAVGYLDGGFSLPIEKIMVLTGRELLGQRLPRRRGKSASTVRADLFTGLQELVPGNPVVHETHGVGRYLGLISMETDGVFSDFLHIEYANETSIYLNVEELDQLHRYSGDDAPKLNKLGSDRWKKTRERVQRDLLSMAHELIEIEAGRREVKRPPAILVGSDHAAYEEFCTRFPFEETDDQVSAIDATLNDLRSDKPMDRVICGDVGFGKTEVALRAAFTVAQFGRQVAVLAPTTVLANQHYSTFLERFSGTGFKVKLLSRLQGKKETDSIFSELASGKIRIVIGTHRLLGSGIEFCDLGMVIVDEEHRFGVKHKERLKALHQSVDLLTMSATPIPRTLHQTLSGLRSVSIISTPPAEREAVRTMVTEYDEYLVCEAIRRELYRGGQIYYLHNHVGSIERIANNLRTLLPEAEIGIAHGKMTPGNLDRQMMAFYEGRLHILVCTTIVESGLDVPNANTLIVERADLLGLAQLHQIRGRVGRSHHQAYAYLFTPDERAMTPDARERLHAIAQHSELGAGFLLARHDMEIRGAGNLLGSEQSGQIEAIGLDLYLEMLTEAVQEAKGEARQPKQPLDMHLQINAILPPDYIPQVGERLSLYRRIAQVESDAQVGTLFEEMSERFGRMPDEAKYCLEAARIRWRARAMAVSRLDVNKGGVRYLFTEKSNLNMASLFTRVQKDAKRFRLKPDGSLMLLGEWHDDRDALKQCAIFLDELLAEKP